MRQASLKLTTLRALLALLPMALLCCLPPAVLAEQRALLVGVGKLDIPGNDLPSIELDLDRMHEMLNLMGFEDRQIHTLQDEDATSSRVIAEFNTWLRQGVQPGDRVVFYFSGHGSNIPDEHGDQDDNVSQVLVTHDVKFTHGKAGASLAGVLPDFRISQLLAAIPSRNVLFIVDSCHSGTVTRSFNLNNHSLGNAPVYVKSLNYPGMPAPPPHAVTRGLATDANRKEPQWDSNANYIAISAAADNQEAMAACLPWDSRMPSSASPARARIRRPGNCATTPTPTSASRSTRTRCTRRRSWAISHWLTRRSRSSR